MAGALTELTCLIWPGCQAGRLQRFRLAAHNAFVCHHASVWLQVARTLNERISKYTVVTLDSCAYAGTSDVLKVQQLLAQAGEHLETEEGGAWKVGGS